MLIFANGLEHKLLMIAAATMFFALSVGPAYASKNGISGRTLKTTTNGCGSCHGSTATTSITVNISGPASLSVGETGRYKATIGNVTGEKGGIDIAVSTGVLSPVSATLKLKNDELVHTGPVSVPVTFEFDYTAPNVAGTITMYATGRATENGWNWAPNYEISIDDVLPVELSSFNAQIKNNRVELTWHTVTERRNYGFEIERGIDLGVEDRRPWQMIGFVKGNGTSDTPHDYIFVDETATGNSTFVYRLKQIDSDGSFEYSPQIAVSLAPQVFALRQNYPNPFNPETRIEYSLPEPARVTIKIYNLIGKTVRTLVIAKQPAGLHSVLWDGKDDLAQYVPSGVYIYQLTAGKTTQTRKMTLIR